MWLGLVLLAACGEPRTTGPKGMVGRVTDATGAPVVGLSVQTVEEERRTDPTGRFAVGWKAPDTYVHFTWRAAWYTRRLRPGDEGREVEMRLPVLREVTLRCEVDCDGRFRWELGSGYEARAPAPCEAGAALAVEGLPAGTPDLTCRVDGRDVPWPLADDGVTLRVLPAAPSPG